MYNGDTWLFALFLAAAAYLFWRSGKKNRRNAVLTVISAVLLVFNQVIFVLTEKLLGGTETYYRFLWMIPVVPILAYVAVDVAVMFPRRGQKFLAAAGIFLIIALAGTPYLTAQSMKKPSEVQYLNGNVAQICELISEDKQVRYPRVACEVNLAMSIRLQDPSIVNVIVRDTYRFDDELPLYNHWRRRQHRLLRMVNGKNVLPRRIVRALKYSDVQYVIIANEYDRDEQMLAAGCTILAKTDLYTIYRAP